MIRPLVSFALLTLAACGPCAQRTVTPPAASPPQPPGASGTGLPGTGAPDPDLVARLAAALAARGPDYRARTEHRLPDGRPRFTNRLILATSPYLGQHAHNPVDWHPWGEEALARARQENKPVFLSVGYATCHWCHVMEKESFEDLAIARYLNEHFIAVKVDREERPDVDALYMTAVHLLHGRGGWPMTVVLTPEGKPFFAATYLPPRAGVRGSRAGLEEVLADLARRYREEPDTVGERAQAITARLTELARPQRPGSVPGAETVLAVVAAAKQSYDAEHGGFGGAPKFPRPVVPALLLRHHRRTGDPQSLAMVTRTLEALSRGGIYDHVGGGFHRYATDAAWRVPHFEKMLYDNAQLAVLYLDAYQVTGREDFARVGREVLEYVGREMTAPGGGFYSATDADSERPDGHEEEGWFFTWTPAELQAALGVEDARFAAEVLGVTAAGNLDGRSVLHRADPQPEHAARLTPLKQALYRHRARRPPPLTDHKINTAWNGLMISAFARGAHVLGEPAFADRARTAAEFLVQHAIVAGRLSRTWNRGTAQPEGFLEDYAFFIQGLIDLYETSFEVRWLALAVQLQNTLDAHYGDPVHGGYFMTAHDAERLLTREKPDYDGAVPSGNSVAAHNLLRLATYTGDEAHRAAAERIFALFSDRIGQGTALAHLAAALEAYLDEPLEVLVVTPGDASPEALVAVTRTTYLPNRARSVVREDEIADHRRVIPLLADKTAKRGRPTAYVCRRGVCKLPTHDPAVLARQLAEVSPLPPG